MTQFALKTQFHQLIDDFEDVEILESFYTAIKSYQNNYKRDILDDLTESQYQRLTESLQQGREGKVISNEQMKAKLVQWLTK